MSELSVLGAGISTAVMSRARSGLPDAPVVPVRDRRPHRLAAAYTAVAANLARAGRPIATATREPSSGHAAG